MHANSCSDKLPFCALALSSTIYFIEYPGSKHECRRSSAHSTREKINFRANATDSLLQGGMNGDDHATSTHFAEESGPPNAHVCQLATVSFAHQAQQTPCHHDALLPPARLLDPATATRSSTPHLHPAQSPAAKFGSFPSRQTLVTQAVPHSLQTNEVAQQVCMLYNLIHSWPCKKATRQFSILCFFCQLSDADTFRTGVSQASRPLPDQQSLQCLIHNLPEDNCLAQDRDKTGKQARHGA